MPQNPWMGTLTLPSAGVAYNLFALIQAADTTVRYPQFSRGQIQLDPGAGASVLYGGNSSVSSTNRGWQLLAGQAKIFEGIEQNLYNLANIWVTSSGSEVEILVEFVVH